MGGAEQDICALVQNVPNTHMVVTEQSGPAGDAAQAAAKDFTGPAGLDFGGLLDIFRKADVVHLHIINDHLFAPLAAQLAGPKVIIATVHNDFETCIGGFADHLFVYNRDAVLLGGLPANTTLTASAISSRPRREPRSSRRRPTKTTGRPLRLIEVRRPDKPMRATLDQIVATGLLDEIPFQATIVGIDTGIDDPRITHVGAQDDVCTLLQQHDVLVHLSAAESFGRVVYEGLLAGPTSSFRT